MTEAPAPLPEAAAWDSASAARWAAHRAPRWTQARRLGAALLTAVVLEVALAPDQPCTAGAPCGPDWLGMILFGLLFGLPYWSYRLPELVPAAVPALFAVLAYGAATGTGGDSLTADAVLAAALLLGWAGSYRRLSARRRQRRAAEQAAAGRRLPLPDGVGPLRRGGPSIALGLLLVAVAGLLVGLALRAIDADRRHEARAVAVPAVVVKQDDESLRVRTAGGERYTVPADFPEDYTGTVPLLVDGDWARLATERYDAAGRQLVVLLFAVPGVSLFAAGLLARRRAAALRRGPVPVLRVRRQRVADIVTVHAVDDTEYAEPLFRCAVIGTEPDSLRPEQHEALLFGTPYEGGELVLLTPQGVERGCGPLRPPGQASGRVGRPEPEPWRPSEADTAEAADALAPGVAPLHWGPTPRMRLAGALIALIPAGLVLALADELTHRRFPPQLLLLLGLPMLTGQAALAANWRITADRSGLWLAGAWRLRHVPWAAVREVSCTANGRIGIQPREGSPWSSAEYRAFGRRATEVPPPSARTAATLLALRDNPRLRPTADLPQRARSLPLGPVLLVGYAILLAVLVAVR
ncbi:hypothetical protein ACIQGZ_02520 [Streptomyces sp. NPDC092296]|uniref:hypothetical protein n=1 Tax=Streptomyces sp. NPDC092296 TaxID=3366012 RepID=UPI0038263205